MTGKQSRPGRGTQPAGESRTQRVTRPTDSPRNTLAWLHDLVATPGLRRRTLVVALAMSTHSSLRRPFPIDVDKLARDTVYAPSTVRDAVADLVRQGRLELVSRRRSDDWRIVRWTNNGPVGRWEQRPALYRLTMGSTEWVGRRRIGTP